MTKIDHSVKYIKFVFENCEVIKIDGSFLGYIDLSDIQKRVGVCGCNAFQTSETANHVAIEIHKDANKPHSVFGFKPEGLIFDRFLKCQDITSVIIATNEEDEYYVLWGDDEYVNPFQSTRIGENGNLYILISEKQNFNETFNFLNEREFPWLRDDWGENEEV